MPLRSSEARHDHWRSNRHERRQIRIDRPQPVADPGSNRGAYQIVAASMQHRHCLTVRLAAAVDRVDHTELIRHPGCVGQQLRDPASRPAVLSELPGDFIRTGLASIFGAASNGNACPSRACSSGL